MNALARPTDLETYLRESASWDSDRMARSQRESRIAWRIGAIGWSCALAASLAVVLLLPLKRVEPYLIRVDTTTGVVDVVPTYVGSTTFGESVARYFLTHYVLTCQRFNFATAESDYQECGAFHSAQRNQAWYALWSPTNPLSPLNMHKDGSSVAVQIESVSFFKRASGVAELAQVRYRQIGRPAGGGSEKLSHWIATVQYAFVAPPADPAVRRWNPLGFKVIEFVTEPEVLQEASASGPSTSLEAP